MLSIRVWITAVVLGAVALAVARPSVAEPTDAAARARESMVIVSSHIGENRDAIGAGVIVAVLPRRIRVVTARHVADNGPVTIWIDGRPWAAEIVRTFADRDLAVLEADDVRLDTRHVRAALVGEPASSGAELYVWGENERGLRIESARLVSRTYDPPVGFAAEPLVSIACDTCAPGDSGAGIFNAQGQLLGILTARYHTRDGRTVALVGERIDALLFAVTDGPVELSRADERARPDDHPRERQ
jgi:S1-C subfamily serine protease